MAKLDLLVIDASHPEETRVVVRSADRRSRGVRLRIRQSQAAARVTSIWRRSPGVEPSAPGGLSSITGGGNRHGLLAFSEIHPDYYQIPVADRQALIEDEARAERERESDEEKRSKRRTRSRKAKTDESVSEDASNDDNDGGDDDEDSVEQLGGDALEEMPERSRTQRKQYKIQEVIKRPPDPARPGRQGGARHQGRGVDHLPLARRPLLGADAQHRARRRHLPQRSPPPTTASA